VNGTLLITGRLARAELRKLFTTPALPVSFAIAIVLAIGRVIIDAMVAGKNGSPRLGTDAAVYQMLKLGAIPCVVMLILGILAAGSEFRHRTIVPVLLATPHRARVFAVKVAVVAGLGAVFGADGRGHRPDRCARPGSRPFPADRGGQHGAGRLWDRHAPGGEPYHDPARRELTGPRRTLGWPRSRFASRMPLVIAPSA
jgi:hypothetical protein